MTGTPRACALFAGSRLLVRMGLIRRFVHASQYQIEKHIERSHAGVGGL
jgi:hypothetical protein